MPRSNVVTTDTQTKTDAWRVSYSGNSTINELIEGILSLRDSGHNLPENKSLLQAVDHVLRLSGKNIEELNGDVLEISKALRSFPTNKTIEEIESEIALPDQEAEVVLTSEETNKSKSLNAQDLKVLLDEYDRNRELKDARKIAESVRKNDKLRNYDQDTLTRWVREKIEAETKAAQMISEKEGVGLNEVSHEKIDLISDEILLTEERLREELAGQDLSEARIEELAEKIVELGEESKTTEDVIKAAKKESVLRVEKEAQSIVEELVEETRAEIATKTREQEIVTSITTSLMQEIEDTGVVLTPEKRARIVEAFREGVDSKIYDPVEFSMEKAELEIVKDENGQIVKNKDGSVQHVEKSPPVTTKVTKIISIANEQVEKKVKQAVKGAEKAATELWRSDGSKVDTAGALLREKRDQMLGVREKVRSGSVADIKAKLAIREGVHEVGQILELRYPSDGKGIRGQEMTIIAEFQAAETISDKGYPQNKRVEAKNATILSGFLRSEDSIKKSFDFVKQHQTVFEGSKETKAVVDFVKKVEATPGLTRLLEISQKFVQLRERLGIRLLERVGGGAAQQIGGLLHIKGLEQFGIQLAEKWGGQTIGAMATHFAGYGFEKGFASILGQLLSTGTVTAVKTGATAAAGATAAGAAAGTAEAAFGVSNPAGWIMLAIHATILAAKSIFKSAEKGIKTVLEILGFNSAKVTQGLKDGAGSLLTKAGKGVMALGTAILTFGGIFSAPITIGPIALWVFAGLLIFGMVSTGQVSSLVSPKLGGGDDAICINVTEANNDTGGKSANCNANAPASNYPGIDKASFVSLAERWSAGGGANASKCFNDVVCKALNAGIHPGYALWAWLHESGASNYSIDGVEDFGIHFISENKNFNAQWDAFAQLDPASGCPSISDYWLAFSTNYLNGSDHCDPDYQNTISGQTGRQYLQDLKNSISWVWKDWSEDKTIHITPQSCGGGTDPGVNRTGSDGNDYICYGGANPGNSPGSLINVPTLNPNIKVPKGCPRGRPVTGGYITQGPHAPNCSHSSMSNAVDFAVPDGTPIHAAADGVVLIGSNSIYGNYVLVISECGGAKVQSRYAHMPDGAAQAAGMSNNMTVKEGQVIGFVDNTGSSTGTHLHYDYKVIEGTPNPPLVDVSNSIGGLSHSLEGCCSRATCE